MVSNCIWQFVFILLMALSLVSCDFRFSKAMSAGQREYTQGDYTAAERSFLDALDWAERYGSVDEVVMVLGYLGRTYDEVGKESEAEAAFNRRRALARSNNLDSATRLETFLALGIFLSKHEKCSNLRQLFVDLQETDYDLKSVSNYSDTVDLIRDLASNRCSSI